MLSRGLTVFLWFVSAAYSLGAAPLGSGSESSALAQARGDHASLAASCGFGQTVDTIRFPGVNHPDQEMLGQISGLHRGELLDREKLQQAMRALFATGRFRNLDAECEPTSQGQIVLSFPSSPNYFIGTITVEGA